MTEDSDNGAVLRHLETELELLREDHLGQNLKTITECLAAGVDNNRENLIGAVSKPCNK